MISVQTEDILNVIERNFKTDKELLDYYHISAPCDEKKAAKKTVSDLKDTQEDFAFYILKESEKEVGFYGKETYKDQRFLTSFFIRPEFRKKEYVEQFWNEVRDKVGAGSYYTGIYSKNTRAAKFLHNNGEMIMESIDKQGHAYQVFEILN